jgi:hypothetical protein
MPGDSLAVRSQPRGTGADQLASIAIVRRLRTKRIHTVSRNSPRLVAINRPSAFSWNNESGVAEYPFGDHHHPRVHQEPGDGGQTVGSVATKASVLQKSQLLSQNSKGYSTLSRWSRAPHATQRTGTDPTARAPRNQRLLLKVGSRRPASYT